MDGSLHKAIGDILDIVHAVFDRLHLLPARGQTLLLQGVTPVGCLGVVVNVVLATPQCPVD